MGRGRNENVRVPFIQDIARTHFLPRISSGPQTLNLLLRNLCLSVLH